MVEAAKYWGRFPSAGGQWGAPCLGRYDIALEASVSGTWGLVVALGLSLRYKGQGPHERCLEWKMFGLVPAEVVRRKSPLATSTADVG